MPKLTKRELSALDMRWVKGTDRFLFSLSDGREVEARAVYLGWVLNVPRFVMLNLGTGKDQPVPFEVPIKSYRKAVNDTAAYNRHLKGEEVECMLSQYAEETARRAKEWGWKEGRHATAEKPLPPVPDPVPEPVTKRITKARPKVRKRSK